MLPILFFVWIGNATAFQSDVHSESAARIIDAISKSSSPNAVWAVSVRDADGTEILNINGGQLMRMASNSKIYVAAALLSELGADFRFRTRLYADGYLADSTWVGNLYFEGSGDPSIDGFFYDDDRMFVFNKLIDSLKGMGIKSIQGDLYGNESLFDEIRYPKGWEWDDLSYYYAPEIGALSFNRNCVDLIVRARGRPGDTPSIEWFPFNTDYVQFINEQIITPSTVRFNESYSRVLGTNTILLRSTLPVGYYETESLTITDPAYFFIDTFRKQAIERGIEWEGELITENIPRNRRRYRQLAYHESEPLGKLIVRLNAYSDNFYTEMLVKALAAYKLNTVGNTETGLGIVSDYLIANGIDQSRFFFRDASGMAGANLSTASSISQLLVQMDRGRHSELWRQSFAQPGNTGTLRHRMLGSPVLGNLKGKTGFISGVRALSGYLTTSGNQELTFSLVTNNFIGRASTVDTVHEAILEVLYELY